MSRGLGHIQRFALAALATNPDGVHVAAVARDLYDRQPTSGEYESVRRALAMLERRGLVEYCVAERASAPWYVSVGSVPSRERPNTYRRVAS